MRATLSQGTPIKASQQSEGPAESGSVARSPSLSVALISFVKNSSYTGAGKWSHRVGAELQARGHHVELLFQDDFPRTAKLGRWGLLIFPLVLLAYELRSTRTNRVMIIHEPSGFWLGLARRLRLVSTPIVAMSHGVESRVNRDMLRAQRAGWVPWQRGRRWRALLLRLWQSDWTLRWADECVCLSRRDAAYLNDRLGIALDRITWTPNGADACEPADGQEFYDLLFLGSWIPEKGSHLLPRIWHRIVEEIPKARLLLAGIGVRRETALESFLPETRSQIEVVESFESAQELARHLGSARVFLLPSVREGSPLALLEAMAAGRAIVASRVGGVDDVLDDESTGLLFDCGDCDGAATRILRLLQEATLRDKLGRAARVQAAALTWERTAIAVERACYSASGATNASG